MNNSAQHPRMTWKEELQAHGESWRWSAGLDYLAVCSLTLLLIIAESTIGFKLIFLSLT